MNIPSDDNKCFLWCVIAHFKDLAHDAQRVSHYMCHESEYNMKGISYPVELNKIAKFTKQNDISVTVLFYDPAAKSGKYFEDEMGKKIPEYGAFGILYSPKEVLKKHVNLLLISNDYTSHYVLIRNMSRLVHSFTKTHNGQAFFCHKCLSSYQSEEKLKAHLNYCGHFRPQAVECPDEKTL